MPAACASRRSPASFASTCMESSSFASVTRKLTKAGDTFGGGVGAATVFDSGAGLLPAASGAGAAGVPVAVSVATGDTEEGAAGPREALHHHTAPRARTKTEATRARARFMGANLA